mgnify:CR=1 FL=1
MPRVDKAEHKNARTSHANTYKITNKRSRHESCTQVMCDVEVVLFEERVAALRSTHGLMAR